MATRTEQPTEPRTPLSRDRVLRAAVRIADEGGLASLTMRRLADALDVEAMSLYYHVANKEDVLDGMTDVVAEEINAAVAASEEGSADGGWKQIARTRILTSREVLLRHPWAPHLFETRSYTSPHILRYYDALLGIMRQGGFSYDLAHHAMHTLGSRGLGFAQELFSPNGQAADTDAAAALESYAEQLPNLVGMLQAVAHDDPGSTLGWCDDRAEFEFSLDVILDGLDRMRGEL